MAVDVIDQPSTIQVWLYDLARDQFTQFTFRDKGVNRHGVWQLDSKRLVFMSSRNGPTTRIFSELADGGGLQQLTNFSSTRGADILPVPYSFCGNVLTFVRFGTSPLETWTLPMGEPPATPDRERTPQPLPLQVAADGAPQLSSDCRWLAYVSDESGRREIYVTPFDGMDSKQRISLDGGNEPMWNPNPRKRELFYRSGDKMMAVEITDKGSAGGNAKEVFRDLTGSR